MISDLNCCKCRASKIHWPVWNEWKTVKFFDKTNIVLGKDSKVHVWCRDDEAFLPRCLGVCANSSPICSASAMFSDCIMYDGVGTLAPINGNIDSQKYIDSLDQNLWPFLTKCFPCFCWTFQDGNAPPHHSKWNSSNDLASAKPWHQYYWKCLETDKSGKGHNTSNHEMNLLLLFWKSGPPLHEPI